MPDFNDPRKLREHLEKVAAEALKGAIVDSQAWLGKSKNSPRQTGRLLSNWFANPVSPSDATTNATDSPQTDAEQLQVKFDGTEYHLTNSLPYAVPVALGEQLPPSWGKVNRVYTAPQSWFRDFTAAVLPEIVKDAAADARRRGGF